MKSFSYRLRLLFFMIIRNYYYRGALFCQKIVEQFDKPGLVLLDVGAWNSPVRKFFKKIKYLTQDVIQNKTNSIDYVCDINSGIPEVKSDSLDIILCTQVLEHLRDPQKVFKEFNRVLKKGGRLFLTTNMCYEEHMVPHDYYRYTRYGLKYLGESNGFNIVSIKPQGGVFQVLFYLIINLPIFIALKRNSLFYFLYLALFTAPFLVLGILTLLLDTLDTEKRLTISYECIFQKVATIK